MSCAIQAAAFTIWKDCACRTGVDKLNQSLAALKNKVSDRLKSLVGSNWSSKQLRISFNLWISELRETKTGDAEAQAEALGEALARARLVASGT